MRSTMSPEVTLLAGVMPRQQKDQGANHSAFRTQTRSQAGLLIQYMGVVELRSPPPILIRQIFRSPGMNWALSV